MIKALTKASLLTHEGISYEGKDYRDNNIGTLISVLQESTKLQRLNLVSNKLTLADGKLSNALANNHTIKKMWLNSNNIGVEGARKLANALRVNTSIQEIDLGFNEIGNDGAGALADSLKVNTTIWLVRLTANQIGDDGARKLAGALKVNNTLKYLDLGDNKIGDAGARNLADALQINLTIRLGLECNMIKKEQKKIRYILDYRIRNNKSLTAVPEKESFRFLEKLIHMPKNGRDFHDKLGELPVLIADVHMMRIFYTAISTFHREGIIRRQEASEYIKNGLSKTSQTCTCRNSIAIFKLISNKAFNDNYIQELDRNLFDNDAEVKRMSNAPFIFDIMEAIKLNTARIDGLESNVEVINESVNAIRKGLKRKMKVEAVVGLLSGIINVFSIGIGGSILSAASATALGSIVDFGDIVHIEKIAAECGVECVKMVEIGKELAAEGRDAAIDRYASSMLEKAIKDGNVLVVVSAIAASMQPASNALVSTKKSFMQPVSGISKHATLIHEHVGNTNIKKDPDGIYTDDLSRVATADDGGCGYSRSHTKSDHDPTLFRASNQALASCADNEQINLLQTKSKDHPTLVSVSNKLLVSEADNEQLILNSDKQFLPTTSSPTFVGMNDNRLSSKQHSITSAEQFAIVEQWLLSHLPQLHREDVSKYSKFLIDDGFDSIAALDVVAEEDLCFMKKGHRRLLLLSLGCE